MLSSKQVKQAIGSGTSLGHEWLPVERGEWMVWVEGIAQGRARITLTVCFKADNTEPGEFCDDESLCDIPRNWTYGA